MAFQATKKRTRLVHELKAFDGLIVKGTADDVAKFSDCEYLRQTLELYKFMGVSVIQLGKQRKFDRKTKAIFCYVHTFTNPYDISIAVAPFGYEHDIRDIPTHRKCYESTLLMFCFGLYCGETIDSYAYDIERYKSNAGKHIRMDSDQAIDIESLAFAKSMDAEETSIYAERETQTCEKCSKWDESLLRFGLSRMLEFEEQLRGIRERNFQTMMTGLRSIQ